MCRSQVPIEYRSSLRTNDIDVTPRYRNLHDADEFRVSIPVENNDELHPEFGSSGPDNSDSSAFFHALSRSNEIISRLGYPPNSGRARSSNTDHFHPRNFRNSARGNAGSRAYEDNSRNGYPPHSRSARSLRSNYIGVTPRYRNLNDNDGLRVSIPVENNDELHPEFGSSGPDNSGNLAFFHALSRANEVISRHGYPPHSGSAR